MKELMEEMSGYETKIEKQVKERDLLQGRLDATLDDLKSDGFDSVEDAEKFVKEKTAEKEIMEKELREDVEEFKNVYAQYLE